jgi:hypothetical protein
MRPKPQQKANKTTDHATQGHWQEMNRKQRREMMRKIQSEDLTLEVVHPNAGGIDIGNEWIIRPRGEFSERCSWRCPSCEWKLVSCNNFSMHGLTSCRKQVEILVIRL